MSDYSSNQETPVPSEDGESLKSVASNLWELPSLPLRANLLPEEYGGTFPSPIIAKDNSLLSLAADSDSIQIQKLEEIRQLVNQESVSPQSALADAMRNHSVVGVGEWHVECQPSPEAEWLAKQMQELKRQGLTHLAVEFASDFQPVFDHFNKSEEGTKFSVSNDVGSAAAGDLKKLLDGHPYFTGLFEAAHDAGIQIVAIDKEEHHGSWDYISSFLSQDSTENPIFERNEAMKKNVMGILSEDPHNKVLLYTGAAHIRNSYGESSDHPAIELIQAALKERGDERGVITFIGVPKLSDDLGTMSLLEKWLLTPLSISTHNRDGLANVLGEASVYSFNNIDFFGTYSQYDNVLLFPRIPYGRNCK